VEIARALIPLTIGLLLGAAAAWLVTAARRAAASTEVAVLRGQAGELTARAESSRRDAAAARAETTAARAETATARAELAAAQAELRSRAEAAADRERLLARRDAELRETFTALSADALARNNEAFVRLAEAKLREATATLAQKADGDAKQHHQAISSLIDPMAQTLQRLDGQLRTVEKERESAYAELRTQVTAMHTTSEQLRHDTQQLVNALRAPHVRGRWGELQLERLVEHAGMVEHCDFQRQAVTSVGDTTVRPDLVVHLAGGKQIVVDAKMPFAAYLEAMETTDPAVREQRLSAHARHLRTHIDQLAAKSYWAAFEPSPEFVVLFVPGDYLLDAALRADPSLLDHAFDRNVVIATPTTLIALLRTIAYTWRQEALARNAAEVHALGRELHARLATMGGHVSKLGRQLGSAVDCYNKAVSSLESRVLVTARRFADLKVTDDELETPEQLERTPRVVQAPELVASATDELVALLEPRELDDYGMPTRPGQSHDMSLRHRSTVNE